VDDPTKLSWIESAMNICALLVAIGVAGEFLGSWISSPIRRRIDDAKDAEISRLNKQAGDALERGAKAEQAAAEANRIAEQERLARVEIEERMADRHLTLGQRQKLQAALKVNGQPPHIELDSLLSAGSEALAYAIEIATVFHDAGWDLQYPRGMRSFSAPLIGIQIDFKLGDPVSSALSEFLARAFTSAGLSASTYGENNVPEKSVVILIGRKNDQTANGAR